MSEKEKLKFQVAQLNGHVAALVGFASALLQSLPEAMTVKALQHFEDQCEGLHATMLGTPGDDVDHQIEAMSDLRETLRRARD